MAPSGNVFSINEAAENARAFEEEEPLPLLIDPGEAPPYPIDALGPLADAARAIEDHTQAPLAIAGQSVLGAAALAAQAHADVVLPTTNQPAPCSLFLLTIAASGERKTAVDGLALHAVRQKEAALHEAYQDEMKAFHTEHAVYDAKRRAAQKAMNKSKSGVDAEADLRDLGDPPEPPLHPMLTCPDPTFEGYVKLTAGGHPALGVFSDEAGAFIGGHGMKPDERLKTAAALSALWNGDAIKRVRAADGVFMLLGRRLSMHLMAQPMVAFGLLGDERLVDQGLLSRLLTCFPTSTMGARLYREPSEESKRMLATYDSRIRQLLDAPPPLRTGTRNELVPRRLDVAPAARNLAIAFADHVEAELGEGGPLAPIQGFANKATEHACRIAAVLELYRDVDAGQVSNDAMEGGIELVQYFLRELTRLRDLAAIPEHLKDAHRLWDWIERKWPAPAIYPTPIYKNGPLRSLRTKDAAVAALRTLEAHGYVRRIEGAEIDGGWRREAWTIRGRRMQP